MLIRLVEKALDLPANPALDWIIRIISCIIRVEPCGFEIFAHALLFGIGERLVNRILEKMFEPVEINEMELVVATSAHPQPSGQWAHVQFNVPVLSSLDVLATLLLLLGIGQRVEPGEVSFGLCSTGAVTTFRAGECCEPPPVEKPFG